MAFRSKILTGEVLPQVRKAREHAQRHERRLLRYQQVFEAHEQGLTVRGNRATPGILPQNSAALSHGGLLSRKNGSGATFHTVAALSSLSARALKSRRS